MNACSHTSMTSSGLKPAGTPSWWSVIQWLVRRWGAGSWNRGARTACRHAVVVERDPVVGQAVGRRVLEQDDPADPPHVPHRLEVGLPGLDIVEAVAERGRT